MTGTFSLYESGNFVPEMTRSSLFSLATGLNIQIPVLLTLFFKDNYGYKPHFLRILTLFSLIYDTFDFYYVVASSLFENFENKMKPTTISPPDSRYPRTPIEEV